MRSLLICCPLTDLFPQFFMADVAPPPLVPSSVSDRLSRVCASSVPYGLKRRCYVGRLCSSSQSATMCYLTDTACGVERNVSHLLVQKYEKRVFQILLISCVWHIISDERQVGFVPGEQTSFHVANYLWTTQQRQKGLLNKLNWSV